VAVGAEEDEVLEAVVRAVAVDVVEREREWLASPLSQAAFLALVRLEARCHQPRLDVVAISLPIPSKNLLER